MELCKESVTTPSGFACHPSEGGELRAFPSFGGVSHRDGVVDPNIVKFLKRNHLASVAVQGWSFSCFYAYYGDDQQLLFLSNDDTSHVKLLSETPNVSGTIASATRTVAKIEGVQFVGVAQKCDDTAMRAIYNKKFPFATLSTVALWAIRLDLVKYTSNIISFGSKIVWRR